MNPADSLAFRLHEEVRRFLMRLRRFEERGLKHPLIPWTNSPGYRRRSRGAPPILPNPAQAGRLPQTVEDGGFSYTS